MIFNKKQKICSILLSAGLGLTIFTPVSALPFIQCDSYVNVRAYPYGQAPIVGHIEDDAVLKPIEEDKFGWLKIQSGQVEGWIAKQYVNFSDPIPTVTVKKGAIYAKDCPQAQATIIAILHKGQELKCTESNAEWTTVILPDGSKGYVDSSLIELNSSQKTAVPVENIQQQQNIVYSEPVVTQVETLSSIQTENYQQIERPNYTINQEENFEYVIERPNYTVNEDSDNYEIIEQEDPYNYIEEDSYDYETINQEDSYNYEEYSYVEEQPVYQQQEESYVEEQISYQQEEESYTTYNESNSDIIEYGSQFIGNPYLWGGNSLTDGIDCSHFVWQVLSNTGHYSGDYEISDGWAELGSEVSSLDEAVAGDVIVYPGHVALYDGQGGLLQARGSAYGITSGRDATYNDILAIRHFD